MQVLTLPAYILYFLTALHFHTSNGIFCTLLICLLFNGLLERIYFRMFCSEHSPITIIIIVIITANRLWQARKIWQCCTLFYTSEGVHFQNFKRLIDSFGETQVKESFLITITLTRCISCRGVYSQKNSKLYYEYSLIQNLWTTGWFL